MLFDARALRFNKAEVLEVFLDDAAPLLYYFIGNI